MSDILELISTSDGVDAIKAMTTFINICNSCKNEIEEEDLRFVEFDLEVDDTKEKSKATFFKVSCSHCGSKYKRIISLVSLSPSQRKEMWDSFENWFVVN